MGGLEKMGLKCHLNHFQFHQYHTTYRTQKAESPRKCTFWACKDHFSDMPRNDYIFYMVVGKSQKPCHVSYNEGNYVQISKLTFCDNGQSQADVARVAWVGVR